MFKIGDKVEFKDRAHLPVSGNYELGKSYTVRFVFLEVDEPTIELEESPDTNGLGGCFARRFKLVAPAKQEEIKGFMISIWAKEWSV